MWPELDIGLAWAKTGASIKSTAMEIFSFISNLFLPSYIRRTKHGTGFKFAPPAPKTPFW